MPSVAGSLAFGFKSYPGYKTREYAYNSYAIAYSRNFSTSPIRYDYTGALADAELSFRIQLGTNSFSENPDPAIQEIAVEVYFYNKTVTGIQAYNDMYKDMDMKAVIDPYTSDSEIGVSNTVTLYFLEGSPIDFTLNWTYLGVDYDGMAGGELAFINADTVAYEANYDTVIRLFGGNENGRFGYSGSVQPAGLSLQSLTYAIGIYDRYLPEYTLVDGQNIDNGTGTPNAYYLYKDPFVGRASDLTENTRMKEVGSGEAGYVPLTADQSKIVWDFYDSDITAQGTLNETQGSYLLVSGHVYSATRGQPVYIKVYVQPWTMTSIHRPIVNSYGEIEYQLMEGESLRFVISSTGISAVDHYRVGFGVREFTINAQTGTLESVGTSVTQRVAFVPQDIDPSTVTYDGKELDENHAYRLYFDEDAIRNLSSGSTVGYFILGDENGRELFRRQNASYQREEVLISEVNMGYGSATSGNIIFVVNPLNPIYPESPLTITGAYNSSTIELLYNNNKDLNPYGFSAELDWQTDRISYGTYIGGGITFVNVLVRLMKGEDLVYEQNMSVMLAFLDMSPDDIIRNENINRLSSPVNREYNEDRYSGKDNPYAEAYSRLMTPLTTAAEALLEGIDEIVYTVERWGKSVIHDGKNLQISEEVTIFGTTYENCYIVRREWNDTYDITAFTTDYALMVDGEAKPMVIVNPFEPQFEIELTDIQGNSALAAEVGTDGYYTLVWFMGDSYSVFNRNGAWNGGRIDVGWRAQINAYRGNGSLVYSEEVEIVLATLDMLPTERKLEPGVDDTGAYAPRSEYTADTYTAANNPYGDWYNVSSAAAGGQTLYEMLSSAARQYAGTDYLLLVSAWNGTVSETIMVYSSADDYYVPVIEFTECNVLSRDL